MFPYLRPRLLPITIKTSNLKILGRQISDYKQGQSPEPKVREYFYYIDHQGMLFLDDARMKNFTSCFKDKKFLSFFFKLLKKNETGRYMEDFPYISLCGRERNFVRCDDLPVVFTKILQKQDNETGKEVPFEPGKLYMNIRTGRVYHPAPERVGGIGLVRSKIAIELSTLFKFEKGEDHGPTHFLWKDERYLLDSEWCKDKVLQTMS
ncbi:UPF0598 protein CG30010 isoform X2 [Megalopta genalis]|uniref:UPF0598 protein CG30010 isoform X2 n=1 Tax=Megalopta genalis TaxID=115081 RepID=UPI001443318C|nr:UPF0598 protein CG30010 isoform X2 [Megalopta genalis]